MPIKLISRYFMALIFIFCTLCCQTQYSSPDNPFAGNWKGTYTGTGDNGSWDIQVDKDGKVSGNVISTVFIQNFTATGTVSSAGQLSVTAGTVSSGAKFVGTLTGNTGSGTWVNTGTPSYNGNWSGTKQ